MFGTRLKKNINSLIKALLLTEGSQESLFLEARKERERSFFDNRIEIRSVIEFSNICRQVCNYCGMNRRSKIERYVLKRDEFLSQIEFIYNRGRKVIVVQSGEIGPNKTIMSLCDMIAAAKSRFTDIEFIGSFGSLQKNQFRRLKEAGISRYILKFETSNPRLYRRIKPYDTLKNRVKCIEYLIELGFRVGTGNIVGLPGQTAEDIAKDLIFIDNFELSMASTSVFIPHSQSKFRRYPAGNIDLALNYIALMRILYPKLIIPSTSCLEILREKGQYLGLMAGANAVSIHDGTPAAIKKLYTIYNHDRFQPDERFVNRIIKKAKNKLLIIRNCVRYFGTGISQ